MIDGKTGMKYGVSYGLLAGNGVLYGMAVLRFIELMLREKWRP
jgi:hypothetical protein